MDDFVDDISVGPYRLVQPDETDLQRAAGLESTYAELDLGLVDASVIALCERLTETKVATLIGATSRSSGLGTAIRCSSCRSSSRSKR